MNGLFPYASEINYLRSRIAEEDVEFKHLRLAPRNTLPRMQLRQLELGLDSRNSRLRFLEAAERKFNAISLAYQQAIQMEGSGRMAMADRR